MIGVIVVGNCVVIKFFELMLVVLCLMYDLIMDIFFKEYVVVMEGEVEMSIVLLKEKFDYIFFIGSMGVGCIVMKVVVEYFMFVMFELGGKSFVIVYKDVDLKLIV